MNYAGWDMIDHTFLKPCKDAPFLSDIYSLIWDFLGILRQLQI